MTDPTTQAKALLAAAGSHSYDDCIYCRNAEGYLDRATEEAHLRSKQAAQEARAAIKRLGFNKHTTLAVAIKLAEAAEHSNAEDCGCKAAPALAEWAGIFP